MRVLIINKFLYPNGGSETYIFKLGEALEQHGHEVQYFGMEHEGRCVGNRVNAYTYLPEVDIKKIVEKRSRKNNAEKVVFGTAGSTSLPRKGHKYVIKALGILKREGITNIEYHIFIGELLSAGKMSVKVLKTNDTWYGMTYHEDVAAVKGSFKKMLEKGVYKTDLFSDL